MYKTNPYYYYSSQFYMIQDINNLEKATVKLVSNFTSLIYTFIGIALIISYTYIYRK